MARDSSGQLLGRASATLGVVLLLSLAAYTRHGSYTEFGLPMSWLTHTNHVSPSSTSQAIRWYDAELVVSHFRIEPVHFAFAFAASSLVAVALALSLLRNGIPPTKFVAMVVASFACLSGSLVGIHVAFVIKVSSLAFVQIALLVACWRYAGSRPFVFLHLLAIVCYWWSIRLIGIFVATKTTVPDVGSGDAIMMSQGLAVSAALTLLMLGGRWVFTRKTNKSGRPGVDVDSA